MTRELPPISRITHVRTAREIVNYGVSGTVAGIQSLLAGVQSLFTGVQVPRDKHQEPLSPSHKAMLLLI